MGLEKKRTSAPCLGNFEIGGGSKQAQHRNPQQEKKRPSTLSEKISDSQAPNFLVIFAGAAISAAKIFGEKWCAAMALDRLKSL